MDWFNNYSSANTISADYATISMGSAIYASPAIYASISESIQSSNVS